MNRRRQDFRLRQGSGGTSPRTGIPGGLFAFVVAVASALIWMLASVLADRPRCPAGAYDGYRAVGCYRSAGER